MSLYGALAQENHFREFTNALVTAAGTMTPQERKQAALDNLFAGFSTTGAGTVPGATVVATEKLGPDGMRSTELQLTAFSLGNGGDNAALGIGNIIYTFPAGNIWFDSASYMGAFSSTGAYTNALDTGLGSVIASGVVSVLGGTATFEDFIGSITTAQLDAGGAGVGVSGLAAAGGISQRMIAAASAHTVHLNAAGTWTDIAAAAPVLFTGHVTIRWRLLSATA